MKIEICNSFNHVFETTVLQNEIRAIKGQIKYMETTFHAAEVLLDREKIEVTEGLDETGDQNFYAFIKESGQIIGLSNDVSELLKSKFDFLKTIQLLKSSKTAWNLTIHSLDELIRLGIGKTDINDPDNQFTDSVKRKSQISFNELGLITSIDNEYFFEYLDGRIVKATTPKEIYYYKYDSSSNILTEEVYSKNNMRILNLIIHRKYENEYEIIKLGTDYLIENKRIYLFDSNSRLEIYYEFNSQVSLDEEIIDKYEPKVRDVFPPSLTFKIAKSCRFTYPHENCVELKEYDSKEALTKCRIVEFKDEDSLERILKDFISELTIEREEELDFLLNDIISHSKKNPLEIVKNKPQSKNYEYLYDKYENWIQKIEFINGKPEEIVKRKIEYY